MYAIAFVLYEGIVGKRSLINTGILATLLWGLPWGHLYQFGVVHELMRAFSSISPNVGSIYIAGYPNPKRAAVVLSIINICGLVSYLYVLMLTPAYIKYKEITPKPATRNQAIKLLVPLLVVTPVLVWICLCDDGTGTIEGEFYIHNFWILIFMRTYTWLAVAYMGLVLRLTLMRTNWTRKRC